MPALEVAAPEGIVTPAEPEDVRPLVEPAAQRFSSPAAQPDGFDPPRDQTGEIARRLGASARALRTAHGMLQRHLAVSGEGTGGQFTASLEGVRRVQLSAPGLMVQGRTTDLSVGVALVADPLVLVVVGTSQIRTLHWSLLPGGPSVTARADGLRFLRGLSTGGQLTFRIGERSPLPAVEVDGATWEEEDEWRLFEDLAALEEWSGASIPMPDVVTADDATRAAQAATWARTQQIVARVPEAFDFSAANGQPFDDPDELHLHQAFSVTVLGIDIALGQGTASVELLRVERDAGSTEDGLNYRAWPATSQLTFWLTAPPGRSLPERRTQAQAVQPPTSDPGKEPLISAQIVRPARRRLGEQLRKRDVSAMPSVRLIEGTAGLLDDIRGE